MSNHCLGLMVHVVFVILKYSVINARLQTTPFIGILSLFFMGSFFALIGNGTALKHKIEQFAMYLYMYSQDVKWARELVHLQPSVGYIEPKHFYLTKFPLWTYQIKFQLLKYKMCSSKCIGIWSPMA